MARKEYKMTSAEKDFLKAFEAQMIRPVAEELKSVWADRWHWLTAYEAEAESLRQAGKLLEAYNVEIQDLKSKVARLAAQVASLTGSTA